MVAIVLGILKIIGILLLIILGLILSGTVEENLRRTLVISDGDLSIFLEHPIAMVLLVIAVISLLSPIIMNAVKKRSAKKQAQ